MGSKNIKKFNRNQSIVAQNFGYLNDDEDDDFGIFLGDCQSNFLKIDPNENVKLHPQNFFKTKICPHFLHVLQSICSK